MHHWPCKACVKSSGPVAVVLSDVCPLVCLTMTTTAPRGRPALRVLYMHGLESGPNGRKVKELKQYFGNDAVRCVDMEVGLFSLRRSNSILRSLLSAAVSPTQWCRLLPSAAATSLEKCVEKQEAAIREFNPDVVVGSSWGGGIAMLCLARSIWRGPTLLIAPALRLVFERLGETPPELTWNTVIEQLRGVASDGGNDNEGNTNTRVLVVHGSLDNTVPISHSKELVAELGGRWELTTIDGGDHKLNDHLLSKSSGGVSDGEARLGPYVAELASVDLTD